jgi:hypothetical protein
MDLMEFPEKVVSKIFYWNKLYNSFFFHILAFEYLIFTAQCNLWAFSHGKQRQPPGITQKGGQSNTHQLRSKNPAIMGYLYTGVLPRLYQEYTKDIHQLSSPYCE